jgi:hypothetical protein
MQEWVWQSITTATNTALAITLAFWGIATAKAAKGKTRTRGLTKSFWVVLALGVLTVVVQVLTAIEHNAYRTDLVLRYQDKFDHLKHERAEGASAILDYLQKGSWDDVDDAKLDSLEEVLGLFDELGFYWKHGQLSAAVLYEHFYDYMRIYCQETRGYIEEQQRAESPDVWEYVRPLFENLAQIEAKKTHRRPEDCRWDRAGLEEGLKAEIRLNRER